MVQTLAQLMQAPGEPLPQVQRRGRDTGPAIPNSPTGPVVPSPSKGPSVIDLTDEDRKRISEKAEKFLGAQEKREPGTSGPVEDPSSPYRAQQNQRDAAREAENSWLLRTFPSFTIKDPIPWYRMSQQISGSYLGAFVGGQQAQRLAARARFGPFGQAIATASGAYLGEIGGSAVGTVIPEAQIWVLKQAGILPRDVQFGLTAEELRTYVSDGLILDAVFGAAFPLIRQGGKTFARQALVRGLFRVGKEGLETANEAFLKYGLKHLDTLSLTQSETLTRGIQIFGMFPWALNDVRRAFLNKKKDIIDQSSVLFMRMGKVLPMARAAENMSRLTQNIWAGAVSGINRRYKSLMDDVNYYYPDIDIADTIKAANAQIASFNERRGQLFDALIEATEDETQKIAISRVSLNHPYIDVLDEISRLGKKVTTEAGEEWRPGIITPEQLDGVIQKIWEQAARMSNNAHGRRYMMDLAEQLKNDMRKALAGPATRMEEVTKTVPKTGPVARGTSPYTAVKEMVPVKVPKSLGNFLKRWNALDNETETVMQALGDNKVAEGMIGTARRGGLQAGEMISLTKLSPEDSVTFARSIMRPGNLDKAAVKELRRIIPATDAGNKRFRSYIASYLKFAFDHAGLNMKEGHLLSNVAHEGTANLSPKSLIDALGMNIIRAGDKLGQKKKLFARTPWEQEATNLGNEATKELFKVANQSGATVTYGEFRRFWELADSIHRVKVPKWGTMIARRGVIGGLRSVLWALTPAAVSYQAGLEGAGVLSTGLAVFGMTNVLGALVSNPKLLRLARHDLDEHLKDQARTQLYASFAKETLKMSQSNPGVPLTPMEMLILNYWVELGKNGYEGASRFIAKLPDLAGKTMVFAENAADLVANGTIDAVQTVKGQLDAAREAGLFKLGREDYAVDISVAQRDLTPGAIARQAYAPTGEMESFQADLEAAGSLGRGLLDAYGGLLRGDFRAQGGGAVRGGNNFGGNRFGGNRLGGNTFGGGFNPQRFSGRLDTVPPSARPNVEGLVPAGMGVRPQERQIGSPQVHGNIRRLRDLLGSPARR